MARQDFLALAVFAWLRIRGSVIALQELQRTSCNLHLVASVVAPLAKRFGPEAVKVTIEILDFEMVEFGTNEAVRGDSDLIANVSRYDGRDCRRVWRAGAQ